MVKEKIRNIHGVKVAKGSGVLIKPLSNDHLYIFTCYHVVKGIEEDSLKCSFSHNSELSSEQLEIIKIVYEEDEDIAIVIVKNIKGLDSFIALDTSYNNEDQLIHVGFPFARDNEMAISPSTIMYIKSCDGSVKDNLIEYEYSKCPIKSEIEGMSGGGIFLENKKKLIGIHKQSSNLDKYELQGKAAYIPISKYKRLIKDHQLSPVLEFNLERFASFIELVFDLRDQKGVLKSVHKLMDSINNYKYDLYDISPIMIFEKLKKEQRINSNTCVDEFDRGHWIHFTEFIIGVMILLDIKKDDMDFVVNIYDRFHYVYSKESFDVFDAREKLDLKLIEGMNGESKLVVGGLDSNHYGGGILKPIHEVPKISRGFLVEDMDITIGSRNLLDKMTIINCSIFKDAICDRCDDISASNNQFEKYKDLLKKKLC